MWGPWATGEDAGGEEEEAMGAEAEGPEAEAGGGWGYPPPWVMQMAAMKGMKGMKGGGWGGGGGGKKGKGGVPHWAQMTDPWGMKGGKGDKGGKKGGKGGSKVETKLAMGETVYHGTVKSYNVEKKHGYIVCEAVFNQCAQDVYAFEDVLKRGFAGPGDTVCFFLHWSAKGQPQASSPLLRLASAADWALKGTFKTAKDPTSAFGFIDCPEVKEYFGRDVYVNKDLAATATPGETVRFNIYMNKDGMPNAFTMEACEPEWEPEASDLSATIHLHHYNDNAKGGWKGGCGGGTQRAKGKPKGGKKGFGEFEAGLQLGMQMAAKGKAKGMSEDDASAAAGLALSVAAKGYGKVMKGKGKGKKGGGGGPASQPTPTGEAHYGTVKSFNELNNYGFIECEEVKATYGNDVFVHGKELNGVGIGDMVYFELGVSQKGQPQALNVASLDANGNPGPAAKRRRLAPGLVTGMVQQQEDEAVLSAIAQSMGTAQWMAGNTAEALLGAA